MSAPEDAPAIHPDWDQDKVLAHLDRMRAEIDRLQIIADAFQEAAEDADREVWQEKARLKSAQEVFAAPRTGGGDRP